MAKPVSPNDGKELPQTIGVRRRSSGPFRHCAMA